MLRVAVQGGEIVCVSAVDIELDEGAQWFDLPSDYDAETQGVILDPDPTEASRSVVAVVSRDEALQWSRNRRLRIASFLAPAADIPTTDYSLLGLFVDPWNFTRGARTWRGYYRPETDQEGDLVPGALVVRDSFTYTFENGMRDIAEVHRASTWYRENGAIGLVKDTSPRPNMKAKKELNRHVRQGRIDFLEASADELLLMADQVPEPYASQYRQVAASIGMLFEFYRVQVTDYIARGTQDLEQALRAEDAPPILQILGIPTAPPSPEFPTGLTIGKSLMYQLTGLPE